MLKRSYFIVLILLVGLGFPVSGDDYASLTAINGRNWASFIGDHLGFLYDSHGCLHFTPSDIYLLYRTVPKGAKLTIKRYSDTQLPDGYAAIPFFREIVNSPDDIARYSAQFQAGATSLLVYPALSRLFILVDGQPVVQVTTQAGPEQFYRLVFDAEPGATISWDPILSTPTDAGNYKILGGISHYLSSTYRDTTIVPFGAWIERRANDWVFQDGSKWFLLPQVIKDDLENPYGQQDFNYLDINLDDSGKIKAARWAGNDFGKYALLWSTDGKHPYPELGYSEGQLLYEQETLIAGLATVLTAPGGDSLEACIAQNYESSLCYAVYQFMASSGEAGSDWLNQTSCGYVRLFNGWPLSAADYANIDGRALKAFQDYKANRLPSRRADRQKTIGLYDFVRDYDRTFDKYAGWFMMVRDDWPFFSDLRKKLRDDFDSYGIFAWENRRNIVRRALNDRLEFRPFEVSTVNRQPLSFAAFFNPEQETSTFTEREKAALRGIISQAASGETKGLEIQSVKALNDYNFGVLLNDMLGNLYKSHGCLHVSPRNIYILNQVLPVGSAVIVKGYGEKADTSFQQLPALADLVNFNDDLTALAQRFADPRAVKAVVYPASSLWVIYLQGQPFARMKIETGFPFTVKMLAGRDKSGRPLFTNETAYPTSPGTFYIFKKLVNYVSNIYHDTTIIPQGGLLKKDSGKWQFQDENGQWQNAPDDIAADLDLPPEQQLYAYYDLVKDSSGQLLRARFGDNTFGKYPIQISANRRTPSPELIHTSGNLMMEQRQLVGDLIRVLAAPYDSFDDCIKQSKNFLLYSTSYNFVQDPYGQSQMGSVESGYYKLYRGLTLEADEQAALPADIFPAFKIYQGQQSALTADEQKLLVSEGLARWQGKTFKLDMPKIYGILYDAYEYVIAIQKNANIYAQLKDHWTELAPLRQALLGDFHRLLINDPTVFREFIREMIIDRTELKHLTQQRAYEILEQLLTESD